MEGFDFSLVSQLKIFFIVKLGELCFYFQANLVMCQSYTQKQQIFQIASVND